MKQSPSPVHSEPINPDGVEIVVRWSKFPVGASVFIPALNMTKLVKQMGQESAARGVELMWAERIEAGKLGVRFWRVL